jgi:hypothetical protein
MPAVVIPEFDSVYELKEAELCNAALMRIGAETIRNTDTDTKELRICRLLYARTRDELLALHPFNFAVSSRFIPIDEDYNRPMNGYSFAFKRNNTFTFAGTNDTDDVVTIASLDVIDDWPSLIGMEVSGSYIPTGTRIISYDTTALTVTLDRATTDVTTAFTARYPVIRILSIGASLDEKFDLVGSGSDARILCNASSTNENGASDTEYLEVRMIEQVIDPDAFSRGFYDSLVLRLASKIAMHLALALNITSTIQGEFASVFKMACDENDSERVVDEPDGYWTEREGW